LRSKIKNIEKFIQGDIFNEP